jgi:ubiquinone/menaquinone biosynthesis C-methylase UbiE
MTQQSHAKAYAGSTAENYQRYFVPAIGAPAASALIEIAELRPGERVLDAACGTGVVTLLASQQVGSSGSVSGLDPNPGMLAVARSTTPTDMHIEWHEATAMGQIINLR